MNFFNGPSTSQNSCAPNSGNENNDHSRGECGLNGNLQKKKKRIKYKKVIVEMQPTEYLSNIPGDAKMDPKISIAADHPYDLTIKDSEMSPKWNANMNNEVAQGQKIEKNFPTNSNIEKEVEVENGIQNNEVEAQDIDNTTLKLWVSYLHAKYPHLYNLPLE